MVGADLSPMTPPRRQRTLTIGGHITVHLVSSLTRQELIKYNICYYLHALKHLNP